MVTWSGVKILRIRFKFNTIEKAYLVFLTIRGMRWLSVSLLRAVWLFGLFQRSKIKSRVCTDYTRLDPGGIELCSIPRWSKIPKWFVTSPLRKEVDLVKWGLRKHLKLSKYRGSLFYAVLLETDCYYKRNLNLVWYYYQYQCPYSVNKFDFDWVLLGCYFHGKICIKTENRFRQTP